MNKKPRLNMTSDDETSKIIEVLKSKHSINISAFIRKSIHDLYEKLENIDES